MFAKNAYGRTAAYDRGSAFWKVVCNAYRLCWTAVAKGTKIKYAWRVRAFCGKCLLSLTIRTAALSKLLIQCYRSTYHYY